MLFLLGTMLVSPALATEITAIDQATIDEDTIEATLETSIDTTTVEQCTTGATTTDSGATCPEPAQPIPLVEVTLDPKNQVTSFGQEVVYHVTMKDNHYTCQSTDCAIMKNEYRITVTGLPFSPEYPARVFLRPGEAESFTIRILPDPTEVGLAQPHEPFVAGQWAKIERSLDVLETRGMGLLSGPLNAGQISVGCALGYLDLRHGERNWRAARPQLAAWFERFGTRPSMVATRPPAA